MIVGDRGVDEQLGLRARDQRACVDRQRDPVELLHAAQVGDRLAELAPRDEREVGRLGIDPDRGVAVGDDRGPVDADRERQQQLGSRAAACRTRPREGARCRPPRARGSRSSRPRQSRIVTATSPTLRRTSALVVPRHRWKRRSTEASPTRRSVSVTLPSQSGRCGWSSSSSLAVGVGSQPEHRLEEQERRTGRPRLRRAGDRVGHRRVRVGPVEAAEQLRQAVVLESLGRFHHLADEPVRRVVEAVPLEAGRDERRVVRPDRAGVIADRVVAGLVGGERPDAPAGEHRRVAGAGRRRRARDPARRCRTTGNGRRCWRSRRPAACRRRAPSRNSAGRPSRTPPRTAWRAGRPRRRAGSRARRRRASRPAAPCAASRRRRSPGPRRGRSAARPRARSDRGSRRSSPSSPG